MPRFFRGKDYFMNYLINPAGDEEFSLPKKVLDCLASASREELAVLEREFAAVRKHR